MRELGLREWPKTCVVRGCENAAVVGAHVWTRARDDGDVEPARAYWWEAVTARPGEAYDLAGTSYDDRTADDPPERIFWPRHRYEDCDSRRVRNLTATPRSKTSVCFGDLLALEYGCM